MKKTYFTIGVLAFLTISPLKAQEAKTDNLNEHRYLAIGFDANIFSKTDLISTSFRPGSRLILNINPIKNLRVDLQFGTSKSTEEYNSGSVIYELDDKSTEFAIGLSGVFPLKDGIKIYSGLRYGKVLLESEYLNYSYNGGQYIENETGFINIISPLFGAEYLFGNRFSIAGELKYSIMNETLGTGSNQDKNQMNLTETSLIFRFYLL